MRKQTTLILNIIGTLFLAAIVALAAFQLLCLSTEAKFCSTSFGYVFVVLLSILAVLLGFFWTQYQKTQQFLKPRRRGHPLPLRKVFHRSINAIWGKEETTAEEGWIVPFDDGTRVVISKREYYYWLLLVSTRQKELEDKGKYKVKSAISQQENVELGRKRWRAYRQLLQEAGALKELNKNIVVIRNRFIEDPWQIIKLIDELLPTIRL